MKVTSILKQTKKNPQPEDFVLFVQSLVRSQNWLFALFMLIILPTQNNIGNIFFFGLAFVVSIMFASTAHFFHLFSCTFITPTTFEG